MLLYRLEHKESYEATACVANLSPTVLDFVDESQVVFNLDSDSFQVSRSALRSVELEPQVDDDIFHTTVKEKDEREHASEDAAPVAVQLGRRTRTRANIRAASRFDESDSD